MKEGSCHRHLGARRSPTSKSSRHESSSGILADRALKDALTRLPSFEDTIARDWDRM
jgi:hypothetical protein